MKVEGHKTERLATRPRISKGFNQNISFSDQMTAMESDTSAVESSFIPNKLVIDSILTLQLMTSNSLNFEEEAEEHGYELLKYLNQIQMELLTGQVSISNLKSLQNVASGKSFNFINPKLKSILDDISTRVAVEIAKLERD